MDTTIYNIDGKEAGKVKLPEDIFGLPWNADLVHQVVVSMMSNEREPIAHTKGRGEVRGGGIKPWKQKGTGRARHGSRRSPIWVGGGVTHGPSNEKNYSRKVNRKMKAKALFTIMSRKLKDGELLFVDGFGFTEPKTARAKEVLAKLGAVKGFEGLSTKRRNAAYIAVAKRDANVSKSFGNFSNVEVDDVKNLNPLSLMKYKYLVIENPSDAVEFLKGKMEKKAAK